MQHPSASATDRHRRQPQARKRSTVRALARLGPYVRPALPRIIASAVAALAASMVALLVPQLLQRLIDGPLSAGDASAVWPAAGAMLALGVAEAVLYALRRLLSLTPTTYVEASMRGALYAKLQDLPVAFHDRWPGGQLLSRAVSDLGTIRRYLSFGIVLLVVNVLTLLAGFAILLWMSPLLGGILLLCSIPLWVYAFLFERRYLTVARRSQEQAGDLATAVEESVHGIRVLKAFGRGGHALRRFTEQAEELRGTELEKARAEAGIWLWLLLVPDVGFALCLLAGVWLAAQGGLGVGTLVAFFATATVLRFPIESIGFFLSATLDTRAATDRFFEILDEPNAVRDPQRPVRLDAPRGELRFEGARFRYQDSPERFGDLLDGVDLAVRPGETMALVGLTGSGKTTLTALVARLYDVTGGRVTIDGVDVRELDRDELRRHVALAFEEATLFSASVRENVLLGRPELAGDGAATRSVADAVLAQALEVAQAQFVHELPEGVDTTIGEEGLSLSGGQRQRVALARAVAAAPRILVLDDPLSALDVDTEARVEAGLRRVLQGTTALIVAHRPSTVALADRVALLERGRITAVGPHAELLEDNAHYREVISSLDDGERVEGIGDGPETPAPPENAATLETTGLEVGR